jgi:hypothetical protein
MAQLKKVVEPFGEVNVYPAPGGKTRVVATILMEPHKEGAQTGIALDGSGSMAKLYGVGQAGVLSSIFGGHKPHNEITPVAQKLCAYLARKIDADGGTTCIYWAVGPNGTQVEVPREGTYGFALGVRSGAGLASEPPQNGDSPAIVVTVDLTAPRLEVMPLEQGRGKNSNKLLISWKCTDDNLPEKPVSLCYSPSGQSPWLPISGPIENTGSYIWTIDPAVVPKFYLRIEARDLAGNVQSVESQQPIVIDLSRPTAKILDVESPSDNGVPRD